MLAGRLVRAFSKRNNQLLLTTTNYSSYAATELSAGVKAKEILRLRHSISRAARHPLFHIQQLNQSIHRTALASKRDGRAKSHLLWFSSTLPMFAIRHGTLTNQSSQCSGSLRGQWRCPLLHCLSQNCCRSRTDQRMLQRLSCMPWSYETKPM